MGLAGSREMSKAGQASAPLLLASHFLGVLASWHLVPREGRWEAEMISSCSASLKENLSSKLKKKMLLYVSSTFQSL